MYVGRYGRRLGCNELRGLGQDDGSDPTAGMTDEQSSAYWAANEPDGTVDTSDYSGSGTDFGSVTGLDSQAPTMPDANTLMNIAKGLIPGAAPSSGGSPSAAPLPGALPPAAPSSASSFGSSVSDFFDPASCADHVCLNDLFDTTQPYIYIGGAVIGLIALLAILPKKAA